MLAVPLLRLLNPLRCVRCGCADALKFKEEFEKCQDGMKAVGGTPTKAPAPAPAEDAKAETTEEAKA